MTMLSSFYAAEGIVFAADSQITVSGQTTRALPPQQKVLRVAGVGVGSGAIGYFGLAQVGSKPLTPWLRDALRSWPGGNAAALGHFVTAALCADATPRELRETSGFHIGAFEQRDGVRVPVFVYARNVDIGPKGYRNLGRFDVHEQLLARDLRGVAPTQVARSFERGRRIMAFPSGTGTAICLFSPRCGKESRTPPRRSSNNPGTSRPTRSTRGRGSPEPSSSRQATFIDFCTHAALRS